jgi:hypothetical protein
MQTAFTTEIDDAVAAVADILSQLDLTQLKKNSVGILSCNWEFPGTGAPEALTAALPFDIIGCTAMGCATERGYGFEQLSLCVLTSDDVSFSVALSEEITPDCAEGPIRECYGDARARLPRDPSLMFVFGPISADISGEVYVKTLDGVSGGVPMFGTLSSETNLTYENARVLYNGATHRSRLALLLISGEVSPRFYTTAISDRNITRKNAVVTESDGYVLKKINDMPVGEYLVSIGVTRDDVAAVFSLPILIDYKDGAAPVAMTLYSQNDDSALCGVYTPVGSEIAFAEVDYNSVLDTVQTTLDAVLADNEKHGASAMFLVPCLSRSLVISPNSEDEMAKTAELLGDRYPYLFMYSGGEICPSVTEDGRTVNRFRNLTYTIMVLE